MTENKPKRESQFKNFAFTWNNYEKTNNYEELITNFAKTKCICLFYSKETSKTTGTPHLQGYIQLINKTRASTIINYFSKLIHVEPAKKCKLANFRYCTKENNAWLYDSSTNFCGKIKVKDYSTLINKSNKIKNDVKNKYNICIDLAKQGKMEDILTYYPHIYLQYKEKLMAIKNDTQKQERLFLNNEYGNFFHCFFLWLWGPTGTGKSYFCNLFVQIINAFYRTLSEQTNKKYEPLRAYYKNKNKWWDRYNNEEIVIIEEASPETMRTSAHYYKQWIDEYPFNPEIKGATLNYIRPKFFIITSNYSLEQCFTDPSTNNIRYEDYDPLNRRLKQIHLTERTNPSWPNLHLLTTYECTIDFVKFKWNNNINDLIQGLDITNNIKTTMNNIYEKNNDIKIFVKRQLENEATTSEQPIKKLKSDDQNNSTSAKGKEPINDESENEN